MSKHTPGPWNILSSPYNDGTPYWRITAGKPEIYDISRNSGFQLSAIMSDADAHLIVAAPDMLAALTRAEKILNNSDTWALGETHNIVRAAIAQAEGCTLTSAQQRDAS